ncbi:hypothetical protein F5879DRAFT_1026834 [Lentinula edodes]|nr:hypothetical protein F5879DRAFT_1026834 [Lentinula edodes]
MAFNKFPSSSFLASHASVSSFGLDVSSTRFFHVSQLDPSLLSVDTLSKALNTLDILSSSSSLSGSDTSAPGSGSSGSGGGGEDLGSEDIGDEGRSSTGLGGGGNTGYSGSGAGAASGVPSGFWDDDDATCSGGAPRPSIRLIFANSVFVAVGIVVPILDVVFVKNMLPMSTSCSWLGWTIIGFARRVSP